MRKLGLILISICYIAQLQAQDTRYVKQIFELYYQKSKELRVRASTVLKKHGQQHPKVQALDKQILALDQAHLHQFKRALRQHGWLSPRKVGYRASNGFFMVLRYANLATIRQFLPAAKKAVQQKRLTAWNYATLVDRTLVLQGKPQHYGTQYYWDTQDQQYYYYQIALDSLNFRRLQMKMRPIETIKNSKKISFLPYQQDESNLSFADTVLQAHYSGANPAFDKLYGGHHYDGLHPINPNVATKKDGKFVSLPTGSYLVLGFGNNSMIDAPGQPDLYIEEEGKAGEKAEVYVSADGKNFVLLGIADGGKETTLDLADIGFKKPVVAVKIVGLDSKGAAPGFDVLSVRALLGAVAGAQSFVPWYTPAQLPTRLKNVLFGFDQWQLSANAKNQINKVVQLMKKHPAITLNLIGHTDMVGKAQKNLQLSKKRVHQVYTYMVAKGIEKSRLHMQFFGKQRPIYQTSAQAKQALNRRVEFKIRTAQAHEVKLQK